MPLYDKPVWVLMRELVKDLDLEKGQTVDRDQIVEWFAKHYPKVKIATIHAHLARMSTNVPSRVHYNANPDGDSDLFYRLDPAHYRLYDPAADPTPIYKGQAPPEEEEDVGAETSEFAYEHDLRDFLARNLALVEPGLRLYEEEGITGIEFPVGSRRIDILAMDEHNCYVVIELKVSRGYDRTVGQLLRYMTWIEKHQADEGQPVRGIIVAKTISEDLKLACARVSDVTLLEYDLSVSLRPIAL